MLRLKRVSEFVIYNVAEEITTGMEKSSVISMLIDQSKKVRSHAYCPYSKFRVGAAVLCNTGEIFTGSLHNIGAVSVVVRPSKDLLL